jgi:hypothetical protein
MRDNNEKIFFKNWTWWCMPVISALETLRQEAYEFEAFLIYIVSS